MNRTRGTIGLAGLSAIVSVLLVAGNGDCQVPQGLGAANPAQQLNTQMRLDMYRKWNKDVQKGSIKAVQESDLIVTDGKQAGGFDEKADDGTAPVQTATVTTTTTPVTETPVVPAQKKAEARLRGETLEQTGSTVGDDRLSPRMRSILEKSRALKKSLCSQTR